MSFGFGDDFGFDDDYVDDIIAKFFADENGVEIVLDSIIDDNIHIADVYDFDPTDSELDAIESENKTVEIYWQIDRV